MLYVMLHILFPSGYRLSHLLLKQCHLFLQHCFSMCMGFKLCRVTVSLAFLYCDHYYSTLSLQPSTDLALQHLAFSVKPATKPRSCGTALTLHAKPSSKQRSSKYLAIQVALSVSVWKQRLIVTAAPLAPDLSQAFLTAGASAVICLDPESASQTSGAEAVDCFKKMYEELFSRGASVPAAMESAGKSAP